MLVLKTTSPAPGASAPKAKPKNVSPVSRARTAWSLAGTRAYRLQRRAVEDFNAVDECVMHHALHRPAGERRVLAF